MNQMNIATRRDFLTRGLGIVGMGTTLPNFMLRSALAAPGGASNDRIVVSLLLTGGPDGLTLAPPYAHDKYYDLRKVLRVPARDVLKLNDEVGLHPRLKRFKELHDDGSMAVVLGTAYPNFNLSHFTGREIWEAAAEGISSRKAGGTGWLGRFVDYACKDPDPALNIAVGPGRLPLIVMGKDHPGIGFVSPDSFRFKGNDSAKGKALYTKLNKMMANSAENDLQFVSQTAVNANSASARLGELASQYKTPITYPDTQFGTSVRTIAGMINGGLSARAYYAAQGIATFGGYDTHADQPRRLDVLLDELGETVSAFYRDLARCGNKDRVLTFTYSEFGRRATENYSGGTDHGQAQPMFLFGPGVKAGVHGTQPSLSDLDARGNLKMQVDFRRVYAGVLDKWLHIPSKAVLGNEFSPVDCIA
ncbi:MAG: hypothetical protein CMN05_10240 [Roseibacillus sp.]|jgi:uncharacterized protein (DUF1501 family)|nr:hypothetical protein [Roseibacillus sp.]MCP4730559.1 DUF1501 domain-containing protein [Roseibacillus sp.]MDP7309150.1 DUF1501 domain-containing protein [Roseibacillus sp.]HJM64709.1 DUF1501 domain-containing protein [Roseibacillus sp.]|tara:strand:- start:6952 stop:8208 length:1257 start_codon:yes stop_codon:yes gene_type:complete